MGRGRQSANNVAALQNGAERGKALDALGAALLRSASSFLVADEFGEPGDDLAQGGVQSAGGLGDVGLKLGSLVWVVDHPWAVAALGVPGGLVVGVRLALLVAVLDVDVNGLAVLSSACVPHPSARSF
jgi:hypothetical protein